MKAVIWFSFVYIVLVTKLQAWWRQLIWFSLVYIKICVYIHACKYDQIQIPYSVDVHGSAGLDPPIGFAN